MYIARLYANLDFFRQNFVKFLISNFSAIRPATGPTIHADRWTDEWTHKTKLKWRFRNFGNLSKLVWPGQIRPATLALTLEMKVQHCPFLPRAIRGVYPLHCYLCMPSCLVLHSQTETTYTVYTRWFKYDRDWCRHIYTQIVPVIISIFIPCNSLMIGYWPTNCTVICF